MDKNARRVKAIGFGEQRIEALGQQPYLDFELKDGTTVRLPHPWRLDPDALTRYEAFRRGDGLDREAVLDADGQQRVHPETGRPLTVVINPPQIDGQPAPATDVRMMRAVLGDENYDKLIAHGIMPSELRAAWEELAQPQAGDASDPKGKKS
ncbi:hypothetical protein ACAG26_24360 [Mycobacterium sp. pUA109]|uniref:hypothetical protein n=1 Tax=Mycobacterium sp. pUA109 TaxID=3238982 RepID=UPI00351BC724